MKNLIDSLKAHGLKITPQRLAIYGYLMDSDQHPSAETIYKSLKEDYPNMSLATVYKTVASLKSAGLVIELNVGEDSFRYDAHIAPHAHIVCRCCHKVVDYPWQGEEQEILRNVEKATGFEIENQQTYYFGLCDNCRD